MLPQIYGTLENMDLVDVNCIADALKILKTLHEVSEDLDSKQHSVAKLYHFCEQPEAETGRIIKSEFAGFYVEGEI